jgi:hypothetical protein
MLDLMTMLRNMSAVPPAPQGAYTGPTAPVDPATSMGIAPPAPVRAAGAQQVPTGPVPDGTTQHVMTDAEAKKSFSNWMDQYGNGGHPANSAPQWFRVMNDAKAGNGGNGGGGGGMAPPGGSLGPNPETGAVINGGMITSPFAALYDQAQINQYALRNPQLVPSIALGRGGGGDFGGGGAGNVRVGTLDWWKPGAHVKYGKGEPK